MSGFLSGNSTNSSGWGGFTNSGAVSGTKDFFQSNSLVAKVAFLVLVVILFVILLSSDIAARTKNIRIGQAASIITFWNPIRAAEDIALLDQLSNGRVEAGVGRGIYGREALNMNADADMGKIRRLTSAFDFNLRHYIYFY